MYEYTIHHQTLRGVSVLFPDGHVKAHSFDAALTEWLAATPNRDAVKDGDTIVIQNDGSYSVKDRGEVGKGIAIFKLKVVPTPKVTFERVTF